MGIDGTFIRPVGTVPENMTWDNARGVWVREGAPRGEDEDEEGEEEDEGEGEAPASAVVAAGKSDVVAGLSRIHI